MPTPPQVGKDKWKSLITAGKQQARIGRIELERLMNLTNGTDRANRSIAKAAGAFLALYEVLDGLQNIVDQHKE